MLIKQWACTFGPQTEFAKLWECNLWTAKWIFQALEMQPRDCWIARWICQALNTFVYTVEVLSAIGFTTALTPPGLKPEVDGIAVDDGDAIPG